MDFEIIDSHVHIGKDYFAEKNLLINNRENRSILTPIEFLKIMKKNDINAGLIMAFPAPIEFYSKGIWYTNEDDKNIRKAVNENDCLFEILAFHPMNYAELENRISEKTKGLKLHTRATSTDPRELIGHPVLEIARKHNLPILIHIGTGDESELILKKKDISLSSALELADKEKDVKFIFAHLGRLHRDLYKSLELSNVYFDTSGISLIDLSPGDFISSTPIKLKTYTSKGIIEHLVNKGYVDKIIWGSDEPYGSSYENELNVIKNSNISSEDKEKILGKNAKRIFKL